jgi:hypothetical protein
MIPPDTPIDLTIAIFRGVVLVVAALGGCLSIFLGWRLYREGFQSPVAGEAVGPGKWVFRLSAAGPGVFFALFGMWLLVHLVDRPADLSSSARLPAPQPSAQSSKSSFAGDESLQNFMLVDTGRAPPRPPIPPDRSCAVWVKTRVFATGATLTPSKIRLDLQHANLFLGTIDASTLSPDDRITLISTRHTLKELIDSVAP